MPRKKKPLREMTKDELAERLIPNKELRRALKKIAHEHDDDNMPIGPRRKTDSQRPSESTV